MGEGKTRRVLCSSLLLSQSIFHLFALRLPCVLCCAALLLLVCVALTINFWLKRLPVQIERNCDWTQRKAESVFGYGFFIGKTHRTVLVTKDLSKEEMAWVKRIWLDCCKEILVSIKIDKKHSQSKRERCQKKNKKKKPKW